MSDADSSSDLEVIPNPSATPATSATPTSTTATAKPKRRREPFFKRLLGALRRSFVTILICLPAILVAGTALALGVVVASTSHEQLVASYNREAERGARTKDHARSSVCFERLSLLEPTRKDFQFRMAQEVAALGDVERAEALILRLAPLDELGYPDAQVWRAARLLQGEIDRNELIDAEMHLKQAIQGQSNNQAAHSILGQLYARSGRFEEAERHLVQVVQRQPEMQLLLSSISREQGKREQSLSWAKSAEKVYRDLLALNPNDEKSRILLSASMIAQNDYPAATQALVDGLARTDTVGLRTALGDLHSRWYDIQSEQAPNDLGARLALLEQGLRYNPANLGLMERINRLMGNDSADAEKARAVLRQLLTTGKATASTHFVLGIDAYQRKRMDEARFHWDRAHELAPEFAVVANNLAWLLADGDKADPDRALSLIDNALERIPNQPDFRGTRGHILLRLKRWKDALVDLEAALAATPNNPNVQTDLAEAYEGLGLPELAKPHREKADALKAEAEARKPKSPGQP